ncbi:YadA-like family protein [Acidaminococcus fermentans]|uniref:YadA-like family protein n=1 Tax=Acidaminococcus fermentans TaxID=905 RepID=UPI00266D8BE3|nr:ESPR-type extended signal peptide-containing protein [Acidaminococcus fermentans]
MYKVIWNKTRGMYMVVSELAKGQSKDGRRAVGRKKVAQTAAALAVFFSIVSMGGTSFAADTGITKVESSTSDTAVEVYTKDGTDSKAAELDTRITNVKEYLEKQTSENYVSKTDAAIQNAGVVKANKKIGENVTALGKGLYDETAARIGADAAQDKVIQAVNDNLVQSVTTINKNVADGFTALNQADAKEAAAREAKDNELNERITNEANGIHNEIKAGDEKLDTRITNVKEYLEKQTSENYVSKADAAVQDGAIVKANKTIGENVTNLDAALASETAARIGADAAQDKVIEQVNQNMADGFNTINTNMANGFAALNAADAAEKDARIGADTKLAEAVNSGLSLSDDNVLQKNTTTVADDGTVTTSKSDAKEMILNKGNKNQITMDEKGVKVGTNSSVMDADGVYTGGDTFDAAKAAMKSDGQIKGANGKFTVDASGNTTVTSLDAGTGTIQTKGDLYAKDATFSGDITAKDATLSGDLSAKDGTFSGDLSAKDGTFSGDVLAKDVTATGTLQGAEVTDGTATMKNGNITGVKDLSAETITTSGDATIGGDLTVKGKLNVDEIDLTKNGIVGDNNVTASTKVAAGEITSYKKATSTKDGSEKESAIDYDENGTSTWAKSTDADGNWKKSTLTVEGSDVTSKVIDSEKNSNESKQTSTESSDVVKDADGNTSTFSQRVKAILQEIKNASGDTLTKVEQTDTAITSQIGDGSAVKSEMTADGITNTAVGGTITNSAKDLVNTATGDMTNTVGGKMLNDVTGDMENKVGGNLTTTVGGNQTTTVTGDSILTAENITNEAKNKITNKALDVETDASSSIVSKVSNEYGSNTSTQLSYQTTEEMSQADGKKASYLRGAAEEKSQLIDGSQKTTIDTIAGQTNTNITDGTNTSNDLQKADQIASSVTDGTNTTVVNQNAGSLASSITDGAKVNNSSNTVDKSEQLIKASDTQYSATSKTATKMEDALVSGGSVIDVIKSLDDAGSPTISSAVTDGTNSTGVTQTAKDITNTAKNGTIANEAKDIINNAAENMTNTVGKDLSTTVGGEMKTTVTGKTMENYNGGLETTITGEEKHTVNGSQINNITGDQTNTIGGNQTTTVTGDSSLSAQNITNTASETLSNSAKNITNTAAKIENTASKSITDKVGDNVSRTMTTSQIKESVVDGANSNTSTKTASKDMNIVTDGTSTSTLSQLAGSVNTSLKEVDSSGNSVKSLNNVQTVSEDITKITDTASGDFSSRSQKANGFTSLVKNNSGGSNTVTDTATTSEQRLVSGNIIDILKDAENGYVNTTVSSGTGDDATSTSVKQGTADITSTATTSIKDVVGKSTVTTTDTGTTFENSDHAAAIGEGSITQTTISGNTLKTGKATADYVDVNKDLTVKGDSDLQGNATVGKDLNVKGNTQLDGNLHVKGSTKLDGTLEVAGKSTFKDAVSMDKDLTVGGNAAVAGDVTASSYKVADKTYIDQNGLNANGQKVTNVADGTIAEGSKDAVNGGQLHATNQRVSTVENRMDRVETRVDNLDNRIDKVGASAAAMANLHPMDFDEDSKVSVAAAVGNYRSETAGALGVFYRPTDRVMMNISTSFGNGENMVGGGVSFKLGKSSKRLQQAEATNAALVKQVTNLQNRLDALLGVLNPNLSKAFPDVPANHWAYEAVSRLAGNDIIQGYEDGKYHGERTMTRYEMAEIIYNALSKGAKAEAKLVEEFRPELQAMAAQRKA